jgi:hypothetical protein
MKRSMNLTTPLFVHNNRICNSSGVEVVDKEDLAYIAAIVNLHEWYELSLKEARDTNIKLREALSDLTDGCHEYDLSDGGTFSVERAREILSMVGKKYNTHTSGVVGGNNND